MAQTRVEHEHRGKDIDHQCHAHGREEGRHPADPEVAQAIGQRDGKGIHGRNGSDGPKALDDSNPIDLDHRGGRSHKASQERSGNLQEIGLR